jgi:hypothetical protein
MSVTASAGSGELAGQLTTGRTTDAELTFRSDHPIGAGQQMEEIMSSALVVDGVPKAHRLDDILIILRKDLLKRSFDLTESEVPESLEVMRNNVKILGLLSEAIWLSQASNKLIARAFGPPNGKRMTDQKST